MTTPAIGSPSEAPPMTTGVGAASAFGIVVDPNASPRWGRKENAMVENETTDPPAPKPKLTSEEAVAMIREIHERLPIPDATDVAVSGRRRAAQVDPAFAAAAVNVAGVVETVQTAVGYTDV